MRTPSGRPNPTYLSDPEALQQGLNLGGAGVWRWKLGSEQLEWTPNLEDVHQLPPGSFDGTLSSFQRDLHPDDAGAVWEKIRDAVESGLPYSAVYRSAPRPNEADRWIETSGGLVTGADGSSYLTGVCLDVTERMEGEHELKRRLLQQNAVARFGSFALAESRFDNVMDNAVELAAEILNVPLTKILQFADGADHLILRAGRGWAEGLVGHGQVGIERESQAGFTLLAGAPVIVKDLLTETRFNGPQLLHDHKVRSGMSVVIPGTDVRPFGVFGIHAQDIRHFDQTDAEFLQSLANIVAGAARQVAATDHQTLLVREMAHRAGNMLQLVNSIASQTFGAEADAQSARKTFAERLKALARANYVVSRGGWTSTRFAELVEGAMEPFGSRISAQGRDILLPPELCFDMGLILHELATNSVKYGTLGKQDGAVIVTWGTRPGADGKKIFFFNWDDPLPFHGNGSTGSGFGSKLVRALIERKWNGSVSVDNSGSFKTTFEVPVSI